MLNHTLNRRHLIQGSAALSATAVMPFGSAKAQTAVRWATVLGAAHPEAQMIQRVSAAIKERTAGRIDMQGFPGSQLGSSAETVEMTIAGAIGLLCEGAAALGQFAPQLSIIEAPYIWRDAAHMAKALSSPLMDEFNNVLVARRGLRIIGSTYYGKRHLTTGNKPIQSAKDMAGFKLRVPPVDIFRAMAEAWGARPTPINFAELYLALSQGAVDGQENPLPTIQTAKLNEVQKFLVLTGHIITPRLIVANDRVWQAIPAADRAIVAAAIKEGTVWHDAELTRQEQELIGTFKASGMTVIEPDLDSFRKPVLADLPKRFEEKWGKGRWDAIQAL
ncbi:MAG: TRAP transporter substrate-binding protein DctP [Bosea sp. (in: a-proteobacteria)]